MDSLEKKVDKILFYLESDPATKHKGLVEQQGINTKDIAEIKTNEKVRVGKNTIIAMALGFIGGNILNIIKLIKLVI